jgi:hypothetical protein
MLKKLFVFLSLVFIFSCGQRSVGDGKMISPLKTPNHDGSYDLVFESLNESIASNFAGEGELIIRDNFLNIKLKVEDSPAETIHYQHLYAFERCPDLRDDLNRDGLLDEYEIVKKTGLVLIPFDSDLTQQEKGYSDQPLSDSSGEYEYQNSVNLDTLFEDLLLPDHNIQDPFRKLKTLIGLRFKKTIVVIFGVHESTSIPETVLTRGHLSQHHSFPIACAQLIQR